VNLLLFLVTAATYAAYALSAQDLLTAQATAGFFQVDQYFEEWEVIAQLASISYQVASFNILLSFFKFFKYLRIHKRLYVLWHTLFQAGSDLITFTLVFFIILLGFIFMGWLVFGTDDPDFQGFVTTLGTNWQFLIGNPPDYGSMYQSNRALGPIYFALFTIFVFFVLVNMFVAIVGESYQAIREQIEEDKKKKKKDKAAKKLRDKNKPKLSYSQQFQEWKEYLQRICSFKLQKNFLSETELLTELKDLTFLDGPLFPTKIAVFNILENNELPPSSRYYNMLKYLHKKSRQYAEKEKEDAVGVSDEHSYLDEIDNHSVGGHSSVVSMELDLVQTESGPQIKHDSEVQDEITTPKSDIALIDQEVAKEKKHHHHTNNLEMADLVKMIQQLHTQQIQLQVTLDSVLKETKKTI